MTKRILIVANTASMIKLFNIRNIRILQELGYEVVVAANFSNPGTVSEAANKKLKQYLKKIQVPFENIEFPRRIGTIKENLHVYKQLASVVDKYSIDAIHTHAPLSSVISRLVARKKKITCIYTSHGFQFFKGSPKKNWLLYYPIEFLLARYTDAIITINKEDYAEAKKFPAKSVYYIPGVGTSIKRSLEISEDERKAIRQKEREKLGVKEDEFLIISVGELSKRKNHISVIRAIESLHDPKIKYVVAGIGPKRDKLLSEAKRLGINGQVKLLGFQPSVKSLYLAADLNAFISLREGLGMGGLEGCALGLYILASLNTGARDYIANEQMGKFITNPLDIQEIASSISEIKKKHIVAKPDKRELLKFDKNNVDKLMKEIYKKELPK